MEVRWGVGPHASLAWDDLVATTTLTDNSAGDTATGESASASVTLPNLSACQLAAPVARMVVETRYATIQAITSWRTVAATDWDIALSNTPCTPPFGEDPPTTGGVAGAILYRWDGAAWVEVDTSSITVSATSTPVSTDSGDRSVTSSSSCRWRIVLNYAHQWFDTNNTFTAALFVSDARLSGTDTGDPCGTDGAGGGDPDPDPGSGDDPYTDDPATSCAYTEDAATSCTYTGDPATSCTYTKDPDC